MTSRSSRITSFNNARAKAIQDRIASLMVQQDKAEKRLGMIKEQIKALIEMEGSRVSPTKGAKEVIEMKTHTVTVEVDMITYTPKKAEFGAEVVKIYDNANCAKIICGRLKGRGAEDYLKVMLRKIAFDSLKAQSA